MVYVTQFIFYGIPVAAVVFFFISMYRYFSAKSAIKKDPSRFSTEQINSRKLIFMISGVVVGALAFVVIALFILMMMAVAHM